MPTSITESMKESERRTKGTDIMKVILSRKGFDSGNGKIPSPIVAGKMLSMPGRCGFDQAGRIVLPLEKVSVDGACKDQPP